MTQPLDDRVLTVRMLLAGATIEASGPPVEVHSALANFYIHLFDLMKTVSSIAAFSTANTTNIVRQ